MRSAIIYIIRCDELGCPDDGMLVVGGSCLLSIGAMVVVVSRCANQIIERWMIAPYGELPTRGDGRKKEATL